MASCQESAAVLIVKADLPESTLADRQAAKDEHAGEAIFVAGGCGTLKEGKGLSPAPCFHTSIL